MRFTLAIFFLFFSFQSKAQLSDSAILKEGVFVYTEQMPEFNGDVNAYIIKHLDIPVSCADQAIDRVVVKFIVDRLGKARIPQMVRGWGMPCDSAILQLINNMPLWKPGRQNGTAVDVYYSLPITIHIE